MSHFNKQILPGSFGRTLRNFAILAQIFKKIHTPQCMEYQCH